MEVDFILNDEVAIQVKAKSRIGPKDLKGLRALKEEALKKKYLLVSHEDRGRRIEEIQVYPWREFIAALWADDLLYDPLFRFGPADPFFNTKATPPYRG